MKQSFKLWNLKSLLSFNIFFGLKSYSKIFWITWSKNICSFTWLVLTSKVEYIKRWSSFHKRANSENRMQTTSAFLAIASFHFSFEAICLVVCTKWFVVNRLPIWFILWVIGEMRGMAHTGIYWKFWFGNSNMGIN